MTTGLFSQNINGKLGINGQFILRDTTNTFLTLPQNTGYLTLNRSFVMQNTTGSTIGVLYKGSERFIHNYQASGTTGQNTFIGINSGNFTMNGTSIDASQNTGVGNFSLSALTTGSSNSAFGLNSLKSTTTGFNNSAFGFASLQANLTGNDNSSFGTLALLLNTTGYGNSAFGVSVLESNTTGFINCAFGNSCLMSNTTGNSNTGFGEQCLTMNITGSGNSAFGQGSLFSLTSGIYNTTIGNSSGSQLTSGNRNIIIGYNAQVPSNTGNDQVRIGNANISYAGIQVAWTITSDRRWKSNILNSNLGLSFISKLRPVSYTRNNDESKKTEYGLIAQEVEEVLKDEGTENTGMLTVTDEGMYELRYNDLLAPMIKAIQELNTENDKLRTENVELKQMFTEFQQTQSRLINKVEQLELKDSDVKEIKLGEK
jgi:hypothetical protein